MGNHPFHCPVLEGGFDEAGRFVHIPFGNLHRMSEYFRRVIVKFFLKKELINAKNATNLINWRHSGFSVAASVHIPAGSSKTREALSQYIARPPLSLKKISIEENGEATVISYTSDNDFFKEKDRILLREPFLVGIDTTYPTARITIYPAIWALCSATEVVRHTGRQNQGQMAGYALYNPPCP